MAARILARTSASRAKFVFYFTALLAMLLCAKLVRVQIVDGPRYAHDAAAQQLHEDDFFARRGTIYDRDGAVLVRSMPSQSVYAVPGQIDADEIPATAEKVAPILGVSVASIEQGLRDRGGHELLARKIPHEAADRLKKLALPGIEIDAEETGARFEPSGRLASTLLGFVGVDDTGLDGIEYSLDALLRGQPGRETYEADEFGRAIPFAPRTIVEEARPGRGIGLTIDSYLQFEAERLLAAQVKKFSSPSGSVIVMDPWTGGILALANYPDFDPTHFASASADARRDRAVQDAYEPGSTFKLITAAAALSSGRVDTESRFPARDTLEVGGRTIHNAEDGFMAGTASTETLADIISYSHNVGAAEVGMAIGPTALYAMIRKFGFGDPTQIELPGENPGIVNPTAEWSGSSLATISFGQGISVTPLALIRAYAAIANGGTLLRPRILSAIYDPNGALIYRYGAEIEERHVISPAVAAILQSYLRDVVVRGTGNPSAHVPGYTTAGKTGTAQVVQNGTYLPGGYIASFIGMIPAVHPRFVILVKIDRPHGLYYGGTVAAPVFSKLAQLAMLHDGVLPDPRLLPRPVKPATVTKKHR